MLHRDLAFRAAYFLTNINIQLLARCFQFNRLRNDDFKCHILNRSRLIDISKMELFRVRMNCIDNYQSTPTKFDPVLRSDVALSQAQKEPKVPVIRVFGATETGQKVCAHIHGAFPYLYVEYTGSLVPEEGK